MTWYDEGMPVINDPDVLGTAGLIKRLYAMPGCDMGGPLHAMLDDGNIDDTQVESDYYDATDGRTIETYLCKHRMVQVGTAWHHVYDDVLHPPAEVADLARLIVASMRRMPSPWRAAAIAWADGTIARNLPILVDNPQAACEASPEQVDDLIAELRLWIEQGGKPGPKACISIPCPQFEPDVPAIQGVERVERTRFELSQSIHHPGVKVTKLDEHGHPVGDPQIVAGWAEAGIKIDRPEPGDTEPRLNWVEQTIRFTGGVDPDLWQVLYGWQVPDIDMQQVRNEPPKVDYPTPWADFLSDNMPLTISVPPDQMPLFVEVPEGTTMDGMSAAIELCKRAGLLDTPHGFVLFPPGMTQP